MAVGYIYVDSLLFLDLITSYGIVCMKVWYVEFIKLYVI